MNIPSFPAGADSSLPREGRTCVRMEDDKERPIRMGLLARLKSFFSASGGGTVAIPPDAFPLGPVGVALAPDGSGARTAAAFGIETLGGVFTPLIGGDSRLPAARTETFSTGAPNQEYVTIHAMKKKPGASAESASLAKALVCGVPPTDAGRPQIAVTFAIDESGNCWVWAREKSDGAAYPIINADDHNAHLDAIRRQAFAQRIGTLRTMKNDGVSTGTTLDRSVGVTTLSLQFNGDTALPASMVEVLRLPPEPEVKKARVTIRVFSGMEGVSPGQGPVARNFLLDVPGKTTLVRVEHFIDVTGTYWFWAKDLLTGEDVPVREET